MWIPYSLCHCVGRGKLSCPHRKGINIPKNLCLPKNMSSYNHCLKRSATLTVGTLSHDKAPCVGHPSIERSFYWYRRYCHGCWCIRDQTQCKGNNEKCWWGAVKEDRTFALNNKMQCSVDQFPCSLIWWVFKIHVCSSFSFLYYIFSFLITFPILTLTLIVNRSNSARPEYKL